jgi:threonine dehydratase
MDHSWKKRARATTIVSEDAIAEAMVFMPEKHHLAVEGPGAVGIAAPLRHKASDLGRNVAVVVRGL